MSQLMLSLAPRALVHPGRGLPCKGLHVGEGHEECGRCCGDSPSRSQIESSVFSAWVSWQGLCHLWAWEDTEEQGQRGLS